MADRAAVSLLEVAEDVGVEIRAPGDAAFEEAEAQLREALRDAAQGIAGLAGWPVEAQAGLAAPRATA